RAVRSVVLTAVRAGAGAARGPQPRLPDRLGCRFPDIPPPPISIDRVPDVGTRPALRNPDHRTRTMTVPANQTNVPETPFPKQDLPPCDLVMKGGITSGVVYPAAVIELARKYKFRRIGGA